MPTNILTRRQPWRGSLRLGAALLAALATLSVAVALFGPDQNDQNITATFTPPAHDGYLLGSDHLGRDLLSWCAAGIVTSLVVAAAVVVLSAAIGVAVGLAAGYFGGGLDSLLMRMVDLQLAIPPILLFLAASVVVRPTMLSLILLLALASWVPYARVVRARTMSERHEPYISAARLAGWGSWRTMLVHLLPANGGAVLVIASLQAGYVLLWEAGLSYLGLGVRPPRSSLGYMIAQGKDLLTTAWWVVTLPGIFVVVLVLAFNLIGDGLRDRLGIREGLTS